MIKELIKKKIIYCDVEFGNSRNFFSGVKTGVLEKDWSNNFIEFSFRSCIVDADILVFENREVKNEIFYRNVKFKVDEDSKIFDFVSRFVVLSDDRPAYIDNIEINHSCSNLYYQYPAKEAIVPIGFDKYLKFEEFNSNYSKFFDNVFYIRDEGVEKNGMKRWIFHHRLIVKKEYANLILRCCHPKFEGPLPFQMVIPSLIKKELFRIREKKFPNFPFMTVGERVVERGEIFELGTVLSLIDG